MSVPAVEIQRQEEASAVASILVETPLKNDTEFNLLHKSMALKTGSNMLQRTVNFILRREECQDIPVKVVTLFVKVKFFHRLKCLNNRLKYAKRKRHRNVRDARKTAQFLN